MTALAAARITDARNIGVQPYPMKASTTIYKGGIVALAGATGLAEPAADTAGMLVVGVAEKTVTSDASTTSYIPVRSGMAFLLVATSITQAMVGDVMYVVDDQTFDDTTGTNSIIAGRLVQYVSATSGWVYIGEPQKDIS